jgi:hypothetical protein
MADGMHLNKLESKIGMTIGGNLNGNNRLKDIVNLPHYHL